MFLFLECLSRLTSKYAYQSLGLKTKAPSKEADCFIRGGAVLEV